MRHLAPAAFAALILGACGNSKHGSAAAAERPAQDPGGATSEPAEEMKPIVETERSVESEPAVEIEAAAPATGAAALEALRAHIAKLQAAPEHDAGIVQVQHVLLAFQGANRSRATRSKDEAEQLAAEIYARALAGEEFGALMAEYSDDSGPGIYTMFAPGAEAPPGAYPRRGMAGAFGDVGWRLAVGELGVAPFEQLASPFGWHVIKRLE